MATPQDFDPARAGDDHRWELAVARQHELRPLLENPDRSRDDVGAAARCLNLHPATIYRLLARYDVGATAQAVVPGVGGWKAGRPRLPARTVEIIDAAIQDMFLDRQAPTKAQLGARSPGVARRQALRRLRPRPLNAACGGLATAEG